MNAEETKLMRRRRQNGFFNTVDDSKFTVTLVHDLSFLKINLYRPEKNSKEKKALLITARLFKVEKQRKKQAEKRTVAKLTNKHAWTEKTQVRQKILYK